MPTLTQLMQALPEPREGPAADASAHAARGALQAPAIPAPLAADAMRPVPVGAAAAARRLAEELLA
jgi:hypothetical protein